MWRMRNEILRLIEEGENLMSMNVFDGDDCFLKRAHIPGYVSLQTDTSESESALFPSMPTHIRNLPPFFFIALNVLTQK